MSEFASLCRANKVTYDGLAEGSGETESSLIVGLSWTVGEQAVDGALDVGLVTAEAGRILGGRAAAYGNGTSKASTGAGCRTSQGVSRKSRGLDVLGAWRFDRVDAVAATARTTREMKERILGDGK